MSEHPEWLLKNAITDVCIMLPAQAGCSVFKDLKHHSFLY